MHSIRERSHIRDDLSVEAAPIAGVALTSAVAAHRVVDKQRRRGRSIGAKVASGCQPGQAEGACGFALGALDDELARVEEAYRLMLVADTCLRSGADRLLLLLGFSQPHVDELRASAGTGGGYPTYALRRIRQTLRVLRKSRDSAIGLMLRGDPLPAREGKCSS